MDAVHSSRHVLTAITLSAMLASCGGSQIPPSPPSAIAQAPQNEKQSKTFKFTGKPKLFVVPDIVTAVTITASGASGPSGGTTNYGSGKYHGGDGGVVKGVLPVSPGEKLYVVVGGEGGTPSGFYGGAGGFNGGGEGGGSGPSEGYGGTGGGGASDVRVGSSALTSRVLVAGGGGGGGLNGGYGGGDGGNGGGKVGDSGGVSNCGVDNADGCGGKGGSQHHGGKGGAGGHRSGFTHGSNGEPGTYGFAGAGGGGAYSDDLGGGGGGGGWFGGGGGGAGSESTSGTGGGGGGGGGSSHVERNIALLENEQGAAPAGNGEVIITWSISSNKSIAAYFRPSSAASRSSTANYAVLYSFKPGGGVNPASGLVADGNALYGTTVYGGDGYCPQGCGTVYVITNAGRNQQVYSFSLSEEDGHYPVAALTLVGTTLYGTTLVGGSGTFFECGVNGCGTVYAVTSSGKETIVHNFTGGFHDGETPEATLLNVNGTLYGSTKFGGFGGGGTIFSLSTTGTEAILHDFPGQSKDGSGPSSPLIDVNGILYGTTEFGGTKNLGTIFSITTSGTETVVHSFKGGAHDGSLPHSLTEVNGELYGTTAAGGSSTTCLGGCGTLFEIGTTIAAKIHILHSFNKHEGTEPGGLTTMNGVLYGVAYSGGDRNDGSLFTTSLTGATRVLHGFGAISDGKNPVGQLLVVGNTLYGTTWAGGSASDGTIYTLQP